MHAVETLLEGTKASFRILHLSASSRMPFMLIDLPPGSTRQTTGKNVLLIMWPLASTSASYRAMGNGLATSSEVRDNPEAARRQLFLRGEEIWQLRLLLPEGKYGLWSASDMGGAEYLGGRALVTANAVMVLPRTRPSRHLVNLPSLALAKALIQERKGLRDLRRNWSSRLGRRG